ncbi:MAG TPA: TRAP transporter fused permease subunit [Rhodocyclaceae bacterium]|nr:TRAP transporter fused permease subunit [Rhodocyclaceae bacterium]
MSSNSPTESGPRPFAAQLGNALAALVPLAGLAWLLDLPRRAGLDVTGEQFLALVAALVTAAALLLNPLARGRAAAVLDAACAAAAAAAWLWMGYHYHDWLLDMASRGPQKWVPGLLALVLLLEGLRRTTGLAITALIGAILLYGFFGHHLPGVFEASYVAPTRLILYLYADSNGVPGLVLGVGATVVLAFMLFGAALKHVGGTEVFTDLALAAMGRHRGGPAKVAILGSSIFGTLSGSTVGNVMSTGMVTIPLMKRSGFPKHYAAAVEAVASNGGQLAPPVMGATAFLIAEFLQTDYRNVVVAALLPAVIYYAVLFMQVDVFAKARGLTGLPAAELPRAAAVLRRGWIFLLPLAFLIYLLFWLSLSAGKAALYCAGLTLLLDLVVTRRLHGFAFYGRLFVEAGQALLPVLLICAAAGIVVGVINISGLGFALTMLLARIGEVAGLLPLLLVTAALAIVLGMGMPTAGVYVLLSVLLAPALIRLGVPAMAAHLFIFYFGLLSMLTPPVAIASYAAGSIAGSPMWQTGLAGVRLGITAYLLPFLFVLNPALLMDGTPWQIGVGLLTALSAGYLLAHGLVAQEVGGRRSVLRQCGYLAAGALVGASSVVFGGDAAVAAALGVAGFVPALWHRRLAAPLDQGRMA